MMSICIIWYKRILHQPGDLPKFVTNPITDRCWSESNNNQKKKKKSQVPQSSWTVQNMTEVKWYTSSSCSVFWWEALRLPVERWNGSPIWPSSTRAFGYDCSCLVAMSQFLNVSSHAFKQPPKKNNNNINNPKNSQTKKSTSEIYQLKMWTSAKWFLQQSNN